MLHRWQTELWDTVVKKQTSMDQLEKGPESGTHDVNHRRVCNIERKPVQSSSDFVDNGLE
jgi:hypothetical protein